MDVLLDYGSIVASSHKFNDMDDGAHYSNEVLQSRDEDCGNYAANDKAANQVALGGFWLAGRPTPCPLPCPGGGVRVLFYFSRKRTP
jgi:hypothetical protein